MGNSTIRNRFGSRKPIRPEKRHPSQFPMENAASRPWFFEGVRLEHLK
jgi:hypothetical protein